MKEKRRFSEFDSSQIDNKKSLKSKKRRETIGGKLLQSRNRQSSPIDSSASYFLSENLNTILSKQNLSKDRAKKLNHSLILSHSCSNENHIDTMNNSILSDTTNLAASNLMLTATSKQRLEDPASYGKENISFSYQHSKTPGSKKAQTEVDSPTASPRSLRLLTESLKKARLEKQHSRLSLDSRKIDEASTVVNKSPSLSDSVSDKVVKSDFQINKKVDVTLSSMEDLFDGLLDTNSRSSSSESSLLVSPHSKSSSPSLPISSYSSPNFSFNLRSISSPLHYSSGISLLPTSGNSDKSKHPTPVKDKKNLDLTKLNSSPRRIVNPMAVDSPARNTRSGATKYVINEAKKRKKESIDILFFDTSPTNNEKQNVSFKGKSTTMPENIIVVKSDLKSVKKTMMMKEEKHSSSGSFVSLHSSGNFFPITDNIPSPSHHSPRFFKLPTSANSDDPEHSTPVKNKKSLTPTKLMSSPRRIANPKAMHSPARNTRSGAMKYVLNEKNKIRRESIDILFSNGSLLANGEKQIFCFNDKSRTIPESISLGKNIFNSTTKTTMITEKLTPARVISSLHCNANPIVEDLQARNTHSGTIKYVLNKENKQGRESIGSLFSDKSPINDGRQEVNVKSKSTTTSEIFGLPKSILSSARKNTKGPENFPRKSVAFGSPEAAEYRIGSPSISLTPMPAKKAKAMFSIPNVSRCEKGENKLSSESNGLSNSKVACDTTVDTDFNLSLLLHDRKGESSSQSTKNDLSTVSHRSIYSAEFKNDNTTIDIELNLNDLIKNVEEEADRKQVVLNDKCKNGEIVQSDLVRDKRSNSIIPEETIVSEFSWGNSFESHIRVSNVLEKENAINEKKTDQKEKVRKKNRRNFIDSSRNNDVKSKLPDEYLSFKDLTSKPMDLSQDDVEISYTSRDNVIAQGSAAKFTGRKSSKILDDNGVHKTVKSSIDCDSSPSLCAKKTKAKKVKIDSENEYVLSNKKYNFKNTNKSKEASSCKASCTTKQNLHGVDVLNNVELHEGPIQDTLSKESPLTHTSENAGNHNLIPLKQEVLPENKILHSDRFSMLKEDFLSSNDQEQRKNCRIDTSEDGETIELEKNLSGLLKQNIFLGSMVDLTKPEKCIPSLDLKGSWDTTMLNHDTSKVRSLFGQTTSLFDESNSMKSKPSMEESPSQMILDEVNTIELEKSVSSMLKASLQISLAAERPPKLTEAIDSYSKSNSMKPRGLKGCPLSESMMSEDSNSKTVELELNMSRLLKVSSGSVNSGLQLSDIGKQCTSPSWLTEMDTEGTPLGINIHKFQTSDPDNISLSSRQEDDTVELETDMGAILALASQEHENIGSLPSIKLTDRFPSTIGKLAPKTNRMSFGQNQINNVIEPRTNDFPMDVSSSPPLVSYNNKLEGRSKSCFSLMKTERLSISAEGEISLDSKCESKLFISEAEVKDTNQSIHNESLQVQYTGGRSFDVTNQEIIQLAGFDQKLVGGKQNIRLDSSIISFYARKNIMKTKIFEPIQNFPQAVCEEVEERVKNMSDCEAYFYKFLSDVSGQKLSFQSWLRQEANKFTIESIANLAQKIVENEWFTWENMVLDSLLQSVNQIHKDFEPENEKLDHFALLLDEMNEVATEVAGEMALKAIQRTLAFHKEKFTELEIDIKNLEGEVEEAQHNLDEVSKALKVVGVILKTTQNFILLQRSTLTNKKEAEYYQQSYQSLRGIGNFSLSHVQESQFILNFHGSYPISTKAFRFFSTGNGKIKCLSEENAPCKMSNNWRNSKLSKDAIAFIKCRLNLVSNDMVQREIETANDLRCLVRKFEWTKGRLETTAQELTALQRRYKILIEKDPEGYKSDFLIHVSFLSVEGGSLVATFELSPSYPFSPLQVSLLPNDLKVSLQSLQRLLMKNAKPGFGYLSRACDVVSAVVE